MAEKLKVYHFPIVHTDDEVGGREVMDSFWVKGKMVDTRPLWQQIREYLGTQKIIYSKVKIYQDGHSVETEEEYGDGMAAVDFMDQGPNKDMLIELMKKGAKLKGTESPELLMQALMRKAEIFSAIEEGMREPTMEGLLAATLKAKDISDALYGLTPLRDRAIAQRIRKTLGPSETGILFLGQAHNIKAHAKGINLISPPHIHEVARRVNAKS